MTTLALRSALPRSHGRCVAPSSSGRAPCMRSAAPQRAHGGVRRPARCSAGRGAEGPGDDVVKELAAKLLDDSPIMAAEVVALAKAEARVAAAQAALADFEAQVAGSSDVAQAQAALERGADAQVAAAQAELSAAEARLLEAATLRQEAQAAAGPLAQLLSGGGGGSGGGQGEGGGKWTQPVDDAAERVESAKAASAAGAAGAFAALPLALAAPGGGLDEAVVLASCALFGVVYRYALRRDLRNPHLKGGVVASFGLVRGLAQAQLFLATAASAQAGPTFEQGAQAALLVGEAVVTFALAAAAVEACFSRGLISPFPVEVGQKRQQ